MELEFQPHPRVTMVLLLVVGVFLFLFAFVDLWYFLRLLVCLAPGRIRQVFSKSRKQLTRDELLKSTSVEGVVLPSDLDCQFHMNNSKYLREMDFGRIFHYLHTNMYSCVVAVGGNVVVGATMIRYRRSLQLWQRFSLKTRFVCWESGALYVEQRFVDRQGFVCAVALLRMAIKGASMEKVLEKLCMDRPQSPPFPPEVESWAEAIVRSKENMKKERIHT